MKQILLMIAVVMGQSVLAAGVARSDGLVEAAIRYSLNKPTGQLTRADLAKVTTLMLAGNKTTDATLRELARHQAMLPRLTHLQVWPNVQFHYNITDAGLREIAKMQQLTRLRLHRANKIIAVGLKEIAKLQKLTYLHLNYSKTTDAGVKEIAKMQKLTRLELVHTDITSSCIRDLAKMQQLKSLSISSTKLSYSLPKTAQFFDDWGALKEGVARVQNQRLTQRSNPWMITMEGKLPC